jgi:Glucoamylase and related glycosyl hydrolases
VVREIALGNGSLLVNLDSSLRVRDIYFPYAGLENHVLGEPNRIGFSADGFSWLSDWDTRPGYAPGTIISDSYAENTEEGLSLEMESCVHCTEDIFLRRLELSNQTDRRRQVEVFFEQVMDLYGTGVGDTAVYRPEMDSVVHYKGERYVAADVRSDGQSALKHYGIYQDSPHSEVASGELNGNPVAQGDVTSAVSAEVELEPGGSEEVFYRLRTGKSLEAAASTSQIVDTTERLFNGTEMCWKGYLGRLSHDVNQLPDRVEDQLKRSILVVLSQTNENGAVTAANDSTNLQFNQDRYGYVWPRDASFVVAAMSRAGLGSKVENFFRFAEDAIEDGGYMRHKYNPDGTLGSSWHPWVDENGEKQLPIQEDETALPVWALWKHSQYTGDTDILEELWDGLVEPAAEFMHSYFDTQTSLPKPSYDLWEEQHYTSTFTVSAVYAGLRAAGEIAAEIGRDGQKYAERADAIKQDGLKHLRSGSTERYVRGIKNGRQMDTVSAPMLFLHEFGLVDGDDEYFQNTVNAIRYDLTNDHEGGIARYKEDQYHATTQDFDDVPGNPWINCTLWLGRHLINTATNSQELKTGKQFLDWATEHSLQSGLLPEQVDPFTGGGVSVAPLTWSHAAYIDTALTLHEKGRELQ